MMFLLIVLLGVGSFGVTMLQLWSWEPVDDWRFVIFPVLGLLLVLLFVSGALWRSNRYYRGVAQAQPLTKGEFIASCVNVTDQNVTPELALDIRDTIEDSLYLPRATLRGDTDLARFGTWAYFTFMPAIVDRYSVTYSNLADSQEDLRLLGNFIWAIERAIGVREIVHRPTAPAQD